MMNNFPICSNCFNDEGLKLDAEKLGIEDNGLCLNCNSNDGKKLDLKSIETLAHKFFVKGTLFRTEYGGAPLIQFNDKQKTSVKFSDWLQNDIKLFEKILKIGFFHYGPRLWMIGEIEPLNSLISENERAKIISRILNEYPTKVLSTLDIFYRLRVNPQNPSDYSEFDSPPQTNNGRMDSEDLSILYGSQDLEVCIHECRVTIEDELFVASLIPKRELRMLDLTELIEENVTEFESLDLAVHMLFFAQKHSYDICRDIAIKIKEAGYDGIIYSSYFSLLRTGAMPFDTVYGISIRRLPNYKQYAKSQIIQNIALFGRPINEGIVNVKCINKLSLNRVIYDYHFGPVKFE
ncbi:MAG: RES family NAD+ phosphorylase [Salinivirgaceae bacterium]|nr:RES family NAD+ phosphorylase [Salinivirgaceae bacterium]